VTGDHDDWQRGATAPDLGQDVEAIHAGHGDVEEQGVGIVGADQRERLLSGRGNRRLVALAAEGLRENFCDLRLVIDDKDLHSSSFVRLTTLVPELFTNLQRLPVGQRGQVLVMIAWLDMETNGTVRALAFIRL